MSYIGRGIGYIEYAVAFSFDDFFVYVKAVATVKQAARIIKKPIQGLYCSVPATSGTVNACVGL